ncbi:MAG: hypothetical protein JXA60_13595 [Candidatus Coatesbacteria bacterium]|nr:hypothetical protein [Candidatus Coatesbacteria bacterium]
MKRLLVISFFFLISGCSFDNNSETRSQVWLKLNNEREEDVIIKSKTFDESDNYERFDGIIPPGQETTISCFIYKDLEIESYIYRKGAFIKIKDYHFDINEFKENNDTILIEL